MPDFSYFKFMTKENGEKFLAIFLCLMFCLTELLFRQTLNQIEEVYSGQLRSVLCLVGNT